MAQAPEFNIVKESNIFYLNSNNNWADCWLILKSDQTLHVLMLPQSTTVATIKLNGFLTISSNSEELGINKPNCFGITQVSTDQCFKFYVLTSDDQVCWVNVIRLQLQSSDIAVTNINGISDSMVNNLIGLVNDMLDVSNNVNSTVDDEMVAMSLARQPDNIANDELFAMSLARQGDNSLNYNNSSNNDSELLALSMICIQQIMDSDVNTQELNNNDNNDNDSKNDDYCSVCMCNIVGNEQGGLKTLTCNHKFHRECIDPWLSTNTTCPNCRRPVT